MQVTIPVLGSIQKRGISVEIADVVDQQRSHRTGSAFIISEHTTFEGGFCLPVDVPLVSSPVWVGGSYSSTDGVGGSSSSLMNYFVPKDKPTSLFNVQQTADVVHVGPVLNVPLLPMLGF